MEPESEDVVGAERAAQILGIGLSTLWKWVKDGKVKRLPARGKKARFLRSELEQLLGAGATDTALIFDAAFRRFAQLPDVFGPDLRAPLGIIRGELFALSQYLKGERHPYSYWSAMVSELEQSLQLIESSEVLAVMDDEDPLRLRGVFQAQLGEAITTIRDSLRDQDEVGTTEQIRRFNRGLRDWVRTAGQWSALRKAGEDCFNTVTKESYIELAHPTEVLVRHRSGIDLNWNATSAFISRPQLMKGLADLIAEAIRGLAWDFDTFCQLSSAAHGLCLLLGLELGKRHMAMDNVTYNFLPADREQDLGNRLVLVDTVVQTGSHLSGAVEQAQKDGRLVEGAVFMAVNDQLTHPEERRSIIDEWREQKRLIYCFKLSKLTPPMMRSAAQ